MSKNKHCNSECESPWLDRIVTPLNACSLETSLPISSHMPITKGTRDSSNRVIGCTEERRRNIPLVIGCYQLNEPSPSTKESDKSWGEEDDGLEKGIDIPNTKKSSRSGELRLFMIPQPSESLHSTLQSDENSNASYSPSKFGDPSHILGMESGVLDGKWRRKLDLKHPTSPLFATACASGRIHIHSLCRKYSDNSRSESDSWSLSPTASSDEPPPEGGSVLCLSLAWNDCWGAQEHDTSNEYSRDQIVSSYSNGTLALHEVTLIDSEFNDTQVEILETHRWDAHTMFGCPSEVWTCSFLRGDENVVMSGADDVSFRLRYDFLIPYVLMV